MFNAISSVLCTLLAVSAEKFFNTTPHPISSNFSCAGRTTGFYSDKPANCKIYHTCDDQGNKFTYHCPAETAFRQDALVCDHAHLVDCERGTRISNGSTDAGEQSSRSAKVPVSNFSSGRSTAQNSLSNGVYAPRRPPASGTTSTSPFDGSSRSSENDRIVVTNQFFNVRIDKDEQGGNKLVFVVNNDRLRQTTESAFFGNGSQAGSTRYSHDSRGTLKNDERSTESTAPQRKPVIHLSIRDGSGSLNSSVAASPFRRISQFADQRSDAQNNNPYGETLRSIQDRRVFSASGETTVRSVDPFTASLKPLVPNELQFDPYYPKDSSTTEAYYTKSVDDRVAKAFQFTTQQPLLGVQFHIPNVLPDLNSLEDFVDRRKLFYIPRTKSI